MACAIADGCDIVHCRAKFGNAKVNDGVVGIQLIFNPIDDNNEVRFRGISIRCGSFKSDAHKGVFTFASDIGIVFPVKLRHRVHFKRILVGDGAAALRHGKGSQSDTVIDVAEARRIGRFQSGGIFKGSITFSQPLEGNIVTGNPHCDGLRLIGGAIVYIGKRVFNHCLVGDKHCHLVCNRLAATVDGDGQRGLSVFDVLSTRHIQRHGDGGIVEGAVARGGPQQVVIVDGIAHDLCFVVFAYGHVVTSGASHHAFGRQTDEVNPCAVAATGLTAVFGVSPFVGMYAFADRISSLGPANVARPVVFLLVVDIEEQFVPVGFRRHLIIE